MGNSLINTTETAKQFVRINFINDVSSLPDFQIAADRFLIPIIGQALYDDLLQQVTADNITDQVLLDKCRAVVAPLGYMLEIGAIQTQLTDAGLRTISTDNMQAAHRWEYNEVKQHLADKGSFAIEALLKWLFANKADYVDWTDSNEYKKLSDLVFNIAEDFNHYYRNISNPYLVFWQLRPVIREVQDLYINSAIGEDFFQELIGKADPTADEQKAIELIKKSVANLTIMKAIKKISAKITENGFTVLLSAISVDASNTGDQVAKDSQLSMLHDDCERDGEAYLVKLKDLLNTKAAADVFATYFTSDYYEAPPTAPEKNFNECKRVFKL